MTFVEEKFIPSGVYNIINARQDFSIIPSYDDGERLIASSNDDHAVCPETSLDLWDFKFLSWSSGRLFFWQIKNGKFVVSAVTLSILNHIQGTEMKYLSDLPNINPMHGLSSDVQQAKILTC